MQKPHNRPFDACLWKWAKRNKSLHEQTTPVCCETETFNRNQALA